MGENDPDELDPDEVDSDQEPTGPPPLTDLDDFELLDLGVNLLRGNRRYDTANRFENVGDLTELEESDLESLEGTDVHAELLRRRAELVAKLAEEEDRLKKVALEEETPEQRAEREANEADQATRSQQELDDQVRQDVLAVNQKFADMRAGRFQVSRRGTFPHLEPSEHEVAFNEILEVLDPARKVAAVMQSASASSVEKVDTWAEADPRTKELARQFFGVVDPVDLAVDGDGYRQAVQSHAEKTDALADWARGQLETHKGRAYK